MSNNIRKLKTKKRYGECFKKARVKQFEDGEFSVNQLGRLYNVPYQSIYKWIAKYSAMANKNAVIVEVPNSQSAKVKALEAKLTEQNALIGRLSIKLDHQEQMIAIYEEQMPEFKKKAASTLRSSTSSPSTLKTDRT